MKDTKKSGVVGPPKGWSKVTVPETKKRSLKRKEVSVSDSNYDDEQDVLDIMPPAKKITPGGKKVPIDVHETPIDNMFFILCLVLRNGSMFVKED